jgi:hypothetical protein
MFQFRLLIVNICILICFVTSAAKEIVTLRDAANRYLNSELVIIGDVFKITQIELRDSVSLLKLSDHYDLGYNLYCVDICYVTIDSILKGCYEDTVITIFNKPYIDFHAEPIEKDTGSFSTVAEVMAVYVKYFNRSFQGGADEIRQTGKHIILVNKKENYYLPSLAAICTEENILFFNEVAKGDSLFLKTLENNQNKFFF